MFIKSWEKKKGNITFYIHLYDNKIVSGSHAGSGHTDVAGSCSVEEFLSGRFHDIIINDFSKKVLKEVISTVKANIKKNK